MKITDSEIIKSGEKELLDAITAYLDWGAVEEIFIKDHGFKIEEDIEFKKGDIKAEETAKGKKYFRCSNRACNLT